jgi:hypothetical protein
MAYFRQLHRFVAQTTDTDAVASVNGFDLEKLGRSKRPEGCRKSICDDQMAGIRQFTLRHVSGL